MKISETRKFGEVFIKVEGELVRENAEEFKKNLLGRAEKMGTKVCLEMWDLDFIDSVGIGTLMEILENLKKDGRTLYFHRVNPQVKRVLTSVHMAGRFNVINTLNVPAG